MKNKLIILVGLIAISFTGCGLKVQDYNPSADNVVKLRSLETTKISVGKFTAVKENETQILCRLAKTIATPSGESFEEYIEKALKSELKMADKYDENSNIKISGKLLNVYGSSMLGKAYWEIEVEVISNNGKSFIVKTKREYPSSFLPDTACSNMSTSFSPTVKQLINDIINHKDFNSILH
jgi:hypothetical protein